MDINIFLDPTKFSQSFFELRFICQVRVTIYMEYIVQSLHHKWVLLPKMMIPASRVG